MPDGIADGPGASEVVWPGARCCRVLLRVQCQAGIDLVTAGSLAAWTGSHKSTRRSCRSP